MLNVEDIKKRYIDNPEPAEVPEIRLKIGDNFGDIRFKEDTHQYFLPSGKELGSVSGFVEKFVHPFDQDAQSKLTAQKEGTTQEAILRRWHEINIRATNSGTAIHLFAENYCYFFLGKTDRFSPVIQPQYEDGYLIPMCPKQQAATKVFEDIYNERDLFPVMPETQVYYEPVYAGTFDLLWYYRSRINPRKSGVLVLDWKTNENLFSDFARKKGKMMKPPFDFLVDEAFGHYNVQLNCYSIPLRRIGINVLGRRILWLKGDGEYQKFQVPDYMAVVENYISQNYF